MRRTILSVVVAAGCSLALGARSASAQTYVPGGSVPPGGYPPGGPWRGYPPVSPWEGYRPGLPWAGYNPPPATPAVPPTVVTQPVSPPPVVSRRAAPAPGVVTRTQPATSTTWRGFRLTNWGRPVTPSQYREFGSGRNVFLFKPWLPNQR
jgi:hypothetical protein